MLRVGAQPRDHSHGGGGRMRQQAQGKARRRTGDEGWQSQAQAWVQVRVQLRRQTPASSAPEHDAAMRGSTEAFALSPLPSPSPRKGSLRQCGLTRGCRYQIEDAPEARRCSKRAEQRAAVARLGSLKWCGFGLYPSGPVTYSWT